jgi:Inhibitor of vertebrate lysozyme (Ivy)
MRLAAAIAVMFATGAACADEAPYLFDRLQKPAYRASWEKLMKEVQPTPDWLMQFNKNLDGVAGQIATQTIDGKEYELSFVCKPQDCAGHKFEVLFEPDSRKAYGALGGADNAPAFYGNPPQPLQDALAAAVKGHS